MEILSNIFSDWNEEAASVSFNNRFIPMRALEESHAICFILMVYYAKNISLAREYSNADETTLQAGGVEG